jgi:ubiquinone/menaquinone biosynthesis C-methylase UbiE
MNLVRTVLRRTFGRPQGLLGRLGGRLMARMNRDCIASVLALLEIGPSDRVLEIGFGPGVGIALAAQSAAFVAGVDLSPEMIAQAEARSAIGIRQGRVDLRLGSAEHLPFEGAMFDKVLSINSMHLWRDRAAGLSEIRRVLKPGGRLALGFAPQSGQQKTGLLEFLASVEWADARIFDLQENYCVLAVNS